MEPQNKQHMEQTSTSASTHKLTLKRTRLGSQVISLDFFIPPLQQSIIFNLFFKGILSWSANFLYVRELILPSSETYFVSKSEVSLPLNQAKTENPGTSSALKSGYPEEYLALKRNSYREITFLGSIQGRAHRYKIKLRKNNQVIINTAPRKRTFLPTNRKPKKTFFPKNHLMKKIYVLEIFFHSKNFDVQSCLIYQYFGCKKKVRT